MSIAIYPGSFDPITLGHIDLVERASKLFDEVIVTVANNTGKSPCFSPKERVMLAKEALSQYDNVRVELFYGLLTDFAKTQHANVIIRGVRAVTDFDYEFQMAGMNRSLDASIETLFLMPGEQYMCVSSRWVREIASLGGDVSNFVPPNVEAALGGKFS